MRAMYTAATGMKAQEMNVEVISNNIANMRTTGFKRQRAEFQDLLYEHVRRIGTQTSDQGNIVPVGVDIGSGVKLVGTPRIMTQGTLTQTDKDLDVAIRGEGYFKIEMNDGTYAYTRDGSFEMDAQGRITTANGNLVQPGITIPPNTTVDHHQSAGTGLGDHRRQTTSNVVGQLTLTRFINKAGTAADRRQPVRGNARLRRAPGRRRQHRRHGRPPAQIRRAVRTSRRSPRSPNLIAAQRAYEMNGKVVTATDSMMQATTSMLRG